MQLTDLRALLIKLVSYDQDTYDGLPGSTTTDQQDAVLNWGLRMVGLSLYLYGEVAFTPATNDRRISLDASAKFGGVNMLSVDRVDIAGNWLRDFTRKPGLYSYDQFRARFPSYRTQAAGIPVAVCRHGRDLLFDKPFNAATAGHASGHAVVGRHLPQPLVSGGNEGLASIPVHLHETVCYLAAVRWASPQATEAEQWQRLQMYSADSASLLTAEFVRQFRDIHNRDPRTDELRESCASYRHVEGKQIASS